jgi:hypothetical protein
MLQFSGLSIALALSLCLSSVLIPGQQKRPVVGYNEAFSIDPSFGSLILCIDWLAATSPSRYSIFLNSSSPTAAGSADRWTKE